MQRENWKSFRLDQLGFVGRGRSRSRPRNDPTLYGGPYPLFETGDIKSTDLYLSKSKKTYNEKGLAQSKLWNPETLCITIAANIAETAILKIKACFPDSVVGFVADPEKTDVRYIKYYIDFIKLQMQNISRGTTQDNLSVEKLLSFEFFTPPLEAQRKIAAVLSAYDDLIENNTRRIEILEEMAGAIYREWFVEFRFPGHEGVEMVESELGLIPQGWAVKQLGEMCHVIMGLSPKSEFYNEIGDGLPFHQGVTDFGKRFPTDRVYCTTQKRIAEADDILFSVRAPVGRINIADKKIVIGRGLSAIRSKDENQVFLLQQLKDRFQEEDTMGSGAIFNAIRKTDLLGIPLLTPTASVIGKFEEIANPIFSELTNLTLKNTNLRQTRDLLLPKLISGEIDISKLNVDID